VSDPTASWDSTLSLLILAKTGDSQALDDLAARYLPLLTRWARGRLPPGARDLADTSDLVQETLVQVFKKIEGFEYRGVGAFQAYLRQAVMNRIRNELRRAGRQPPREELDEKQADDRPSPLEEAIGSEMVELYEAALQRLSPKERELIIARVELGLTYAEIAEALTMPSADAARMAVARALVRLAEEMREGEPPAR